MEACSSYELSKNFPESEWRAVWQAAPLLKSGHRRSDASSSWGNCASLNLQRWHRNQHCPLSVWADGTQTANPSVAGDSVATQQWIGQRVATVRSPRDDPWAACSLSMLANSTVLFSQYFFLLKFLINLMSCYNKLQFLYTITIWIWVRSNQCTTSALLKSLSFYYKTLYAWFCIIDSRDRHEAQSCFGLLKLGLWTSSSYI